jgi:hypothetical protein
MMMLDADAAHRQLCVLWLPPRSFLPWRASCIADVARYRVRHVALQHSARAADVDRAAELDVEPSPCASMPLTADDLALAARACRAMAYQEGERAKKMENPTSRRAPWVSDSTFQGGGGSVSDAVCPAVAT